MAGFTDVTVLASAGHIMSLNDGGPTFNSGIYPEQKFKMNLAVADEKKKIVADIAAQAKLADKIIIFTNGDREGEVIGWSIIKFCALPSEKCFRAISHEMTHKAIVNAIENTVSFNIGLVNAGLARLLVDKLIGYGLSPICKKYLGVKSVGRYQSIGLKLVVDRESEINNFIPDLYFDILLTFTKGTNTLEARYCGDGSERIDKLTRQADANAVVTDCGDNQFYVEEANINIKKASPKLPFCTATFQQEAASKLGLRAKEAMSYAKKLFEGVNIDGQYSGLITYMYTDSTHFNAEFETTLKKFIASTYGETKYNKPNKIKQKNTNQSGCEALRVTDLSITPEVLSTKIKNQALIRVYELIWQRTVSARMPDAVVQETQYIINNNNHKFELCVKELLELGYGEVYSFDNYAYDTPAIHFYIGEKLENTDIITTKKFTQPRSRYTEAGFINELQQEGIGRPSTYTTIIETMLSPTRGYAKLEEKFIVPTDRGIQLADYCNRSFPKLININYIAELEANLDKIASGTVNWFDYMDNFYSNLKDTIDKTIETGINQGMSEKLCPICGGSLIIRRSRFGKLFYGCSNYPKCTNTISI